jgi:hypothetical protein
MQELHRRLAKATVHLHREGYEAVAMRLHSCIRTPPLLVPMGCRRSSRGSRLGEGIHGEGVDDRKVGDGDALWQGHEDVAPSLGANGQDVGGGASAGSEAWESARGGSRVEAMPARCTTRSKIPFRMSLRSVNCVARAEHRMPWSVSVRWRVTTQPHCTVGALRGRMARPRRCRRAVWNSPLLSSRAVELTRLLFWVWRLPGWGLPQRLPVR